MEDKLECCKNSKGWHYEIESNYKLKKDFSAEFEPITFIVKFDNKTISIINLYKYPTIEECEELLKSAKENFFLRMNI